MDLQNYNRPCLFYALKDLQIVNLMRKKKIDEDLTTVEFHKNRIKKLAWVGIGLEDLLRSR